MSKIASSKYVLSVLLLTMVGCAAPGDEASEASSTNAIVRLPPKDGMPPKAAALLTGYRVQAISSTAGCAAAKTDAVGGWADGSMKATLQQGCDYVLTVELGQLAPTKKSLVATYFSNATGGMTGTAIPASSFTGKPSINVAVVVKVTPDGIAAGFDTAPTIPAGTTDVGIDVTIGGTPKPPATASSMRDVLDQAKSPNGTVVKLEKVVVTAPGDSWSEGGSPSTYQCASYAVVQDAACTAPPCGIGLRESTATPSCGAFAPALGKLPVGAVVDVTGTVRIAQGISHVEIAQVTDSGVRSPIAPMKVDLAATFADNAQLAKYMNTLVTADLTPARAISRSVSSSGNIVSFYFTAADLAGVTFFDPTNVSPVRTGDLVKQATGIPQYRDGALKVLRLRAATDLVVQL